jgi:hypothetical protein
MLYQLRCLHVIRFVLSVFLLIAIGLCVAKVTTAESIWLRPPYNGTYRLNTFFDHHYPNYGQDNEITIYTGESVVTCSPHCYHGHPGYDWSMATATPVLAAADGTVRETFLSNVLYGNSIVIEHDNGYYTLYAHLRDPNPFNVMEGQRVNAGDVIGWSGSTGNSTGPHLHFGVYLGPFTRQTNDERYATDTFGWRGSYPDPLLNRPAPGLRHAASCLWRSRDEDPVSCADTIVEDAGRGSTITGTWTVGNRGNGYHTYYRTNTTDNGVQASWVTTSVVPGVYKVYAFIPEQPPGVTTPRTQQAQYSIWTDTSWQTRVVNQSIYTNTWVLLGTFRIPAAQAQVALSANTGEAVGTRLVMADAIKFRSYLASLPSVLKNYPIPVCVEGTSLIQNGDFEQGNSIWTEQSPYGTIIRNSNLPVPPLSGSWEAWLVGYDNANDILRQSVIIPSNINSVSMVWYVWIHSNEGTSTAYDRLYMRIYDYDGTLLAQYEVNNTTIRDTWLQITMPLSGLNLHVGHEWQISFEGTSDNSLVTHFVVDDVSFVTHCGTGSSSLQMGPVQIMPVQTAQPSGSLGPKP